VPSLSRALPPLPPAGLPALVALDLSGRPLGPTSLAVLASGLAASTALARLSLAGCGPGVGPALPPALARHAPSLVALDCSHCGLVSLPAWLGRATRLVSLDVRANPGLALRGDARAPVDLPQQFERAIAQRAEGRDAWLHVSAKWQPGP
jgi:hypothetical protein